MSIALTTVHESGGSGFDAGLENQENIINLATNSNPVNNTNGAASQNSVSSIGDETDNQINIPQLYKSIILGVRPVKKAKKNINMNTFQNNNILQFSSS
jgi:uncharacterized protein (DUF4213/DUF364 family)